MIKKDLVDKSPLRKLYQSIHGGVGAGNIGVIASRRGIGKTACLVHIATDKLMAGENVIHVSYAKRVDHIIRWYEDIFREISRNRELENAMSIHEELIQNRVIMNFSQQGSNVKQVLASLKAMMDNGLKDTNAIMIDGFDFSQTSSAELAEYKAFAAKENVELWFTSDFHRDDADGLGLNDAGIPSNLENYLDLVDVIVILKAEEDYLHLYLVKDYETINKEDLPLKLDPKSLLIADI